jgi:hypothetical protein
MRVVPTRYLRFVPTLFNLTQLLLGVWWFTPTHSSKILEVEQHPAISASWLLCLESEAFSGDGIQSGIQKRKGPYEVSGNYM